ncbi:hypothetical protein SAMN05421748_12965 [Paractinoplanes atraurantiacus]|uniref:Uncharacterized protein n=2 Tax=Paractinoplanes atraurantiacus TaxID=1036182 RepID=A0A285K1A2_9ACTN|nr:hypothetical protein SAMN05421748_12965 [Actinoplanes atraurantiacus]
MVVAVLVILLALMIGVMVSWFRVPPPSAQAPSSEFSPEPSSEPSSPAPWPPALSSLLRRLRSPSPPAAPGSAPSTVPSPSPSPSLSPESLEGALAAQLASGAITRPQYLRAMEWVAFREEERHPMEPLEDGRG